MIGSLYVPGDTPLHRLDAGWKLAALCLFGLLLFTTDVLLILALALTISLILVMASGATLARLRQQLTAPLIIIAFLFVITGLLVSWPGAVATALRLATLVFAGYAVTLTTPVSAFLEAIEGALAPLDRLGLVNAAHAALAISLVFRFIPVILDQARAIREAQAARGLERNILALLVPLIVHVLKAADDIASAIDARSYPPARAANTPLPTRRDDNA
ncbi:energy-coupling factor transporter transmembrane component T family protein [Rhodoligotrophos defluvii]|uniref:energy-coupling factor transporter transmembrane component T family protein n=1 Tax=Rhodoligotrophos defluvii TaxID=2561934 RepID=UPI0010C9F169|nr:energy-coupling factor transporter transmembrane protein EcfT [Rhodoligotrophos defluvii]